jgi:hypothetical protein
MKRRGGRHKQLQDNLQKKNRYWQKHGPPVAAIMSKLRITRQAMHE